MYKRQVLFDLRWSVIPRREGGIEVFGGNDGKIVLESEEEVKDLCEEMCIRDSRCTAAGIRMGAESRTVHL